MTSDQDGSQSTDLDERPGRRVLIIYYSQSGDVAQAVESFVEPLGRADVALVWERLRPRQDYPWPWRSVRTFFDVMPESVLDLPPEIYPPAFDPDQRYDLVILAYQVWYLSPSLPIQSFLESAHARVLRGTKVLTIVVCRNMWHSASETMKRRLAGLGAHHIDNVTVTHQGPAWATFVTTPRWLLFGRRDRLWGVFPPAGIAPADVEALARFGDAVGDQLDSLSEPTPRPLLRGLGAATVEERYIMPELVARRVFRAWAHVLRRLGRPGGRARSAGVYLFVVSLLGLITVALPIGVLSGLLLRPILRKRIAAYAARLSEPSGA